MDGDIYIYIYKICVYICTFGDEGSLIKERTAKQINTGSAFLLVLV